MGLDLTEISKKRLYFWVSQPRKTFTYVWFVSLLLVLITFIVSCIAASRLKNAGGAGIYPLIHSFTHSRTSFTYFFTYYCLFITFGSLLLKLLTLLPN